MRIKFIRENPLTTTIFVITTLLLVFQHQTTLSWDFSAYVLNAKYLFYGGDYFEVYRAPLPSLLLGIFLILGKFGELIYIIFTSSIFFYANIKLADALFTRTQISKEKTRFLFYLFSLSGFVLIYATSAGTELLSLALLEIFLVQLLNKNVSGHFLALATLTRYNNLIFAPLMLFNKDYKIVLKNLIYFSIILSAWFLFNYIKFGNWFTSIVDSYALNVHFRDYLIQPFHISSISPIITWFAPFLLIGLIISLISLYKSKEGFTSKKGILLIGLIAILTLYDIYSTPLKIERYMFNLSLPIAFFSTLGAIHLLKRYKSYSRPIIAILFSILLITVGLIATEVYQGRNTADKFYDVANDIKTLRLQECEILSPHWTPMNYLTGNVRPLGANTLKNSIEIHKIVLIFLGNPTIDDGFTSEMLESSPKLIETEEYVLLAKEDITPENCYKKKPYDSPYTKKHCEIIGEKFESIKLNNLAESTCNYINKI